MNSPQPTTHTQGVPKVLLVADCTIDPDGRWTIDAADDDGNTYFIVDAINPLTYPSNASRRKWKQRSKASAPTVNLIQSLIEGRDPYLELWDAYKALLGYPWAAHRITEQAGADDE